LRCFKRGLLCFLSKSLLNAKRTSAVVLHTVRDLSLPPVAAGHSALRLLPASICSGVLAFFSWFQYLSWLGPLVARELCSHTFLPSQNGHLVPCVRSSESCVSELHQSFGLLVTKTAAVLAVFHAHGCTSYKVDMSSIAGIGKDDVKHNTWKRGATYEPTFLMTSHEVLKKAHELSMNGVTKKQHCPQQAQWAPNASGKDVHALCLPSWSWGALLMTSHLDRKHMVSHKMHISFGHQEQNISIKTWQTSSTFSAQETMTVFNVTPAQPM